MNNKIIVIAGKGNLPKVLINEIIKRDFVIHILFIKGNEIKNSLKNYSHTVTSYGSIITKLLKLKKNGFKKIIFAGSLEKPDLKKIRPDLNMIKFLPRLSKIFLQGGDDRLLSFLIKELELMKFEILNIKEFLLNYFPSHGNITKIKPTKIASSDIRIGKTILDNLSPMDVGQAIIIQQGDVLGIEAVEGTDNLIKRTKKFIKNGEKPTLIKLKKKKQDLRADLPTIGLNTIKLCKKNLIGGIAFSANYTLFIDFKKIIEELKKGNFFLHGIK